MDWLDRLPTRTVIRIVPLGVSILVFVTLYAAAKLFVRWRNKHRDSD
jgi:hypothetical protein